MLDRRKGDEMSEVGFQGESESLNEDMGQPDAHPSRQMRPESSVQVAVVGAGLAGLTAAYRLQQAGVDVAIYEANPDRVGGRCWTERSFFAGGLIAEHGPERIDTRYQEIRALADELGLELLDHLGDNQEMTWVLVKDDPLASENGARSAGQIFHDALLADMARRGISVGGPQHEGELSEAEAALDSISLRDWIEDNLDGGLTSPVGQAYAPAIALARGRELDELSAYYFVAGYDMFAGTFIGKVDSEHIDRIADHRYQVRGGNSRVPEELRARLSPGVLTLAAKLTKIVKAPDDRYYLEFASGASVAAAAVILALPFTTLRHVDLTDAGFSASKRAAIEEFDIGTLTKIIMQFDRPQSDFPDWDGVVFNEDPRLMALCTSDGQEGQEGAGMIVTGFYGGADSRALSNGAAHAPAPEAVVTPMLDVLDSAVPGLKAAFTGLAWMDSWGDSEYSEGAYSSFRPGQAARFAHVIATPEGGVFFAGEHTSTRYRSSMNGAVESGQRATREALAYLA
jgi:monoamine oxidase